MAKHPPILPTTCSFCLAAILRRMPKSGQCFCNTDCKAQWQRLAKPVTREWLEEQYVQKGLDCVQIAAIVCRDPKSVWNWLKDFDIPTRSRGFASSQNFFKKGEPSRWAGHAHTPEWKRAFSAKCKAEGRVPYNPAVGSYMKGRKGAATTNWKGGITPARQSFYSSEEWIACAKSVWARDQKTCQLCGSVKRNRERFDLHHIDGFSIVEKRGII